MSVIVLLIRNEVNRFSVVTFIVPILKVMLGLSLGCGKMRPVLFLRLVNLIFSELN